jgi:hypothetical protein
MSYTKGPWELSSMAIWAKSPWNARVIIARVMAHSEMNGLDFAADAKLMTASPLLLEAAKAALVFAEQELEQRQQSNDAAYISKAADVVERLQNAIDTAEGVVREEAENEWSDA